MAWEDLMEMEDYLQERKVFLCGLDGRPCHSDSYMTIVQFDALAAAFDASPFDLGRWAEAVNYWLTNPNMQPPLRLVALQAIRRFKLFPYVE